MDGLNGWSNGGEQTRLICRKKDRGHMSESRREGMYLPRLYNVIKAILPFGEDFIFYTITISLHIGHDIDMSQLSLYNYHMLPILFIISFFFFKEISGLISIIIIIEIVDFSKIVHKSSILIKIFD